MANEGSNPIDLVENFGLPPLLVAPEIVRTNWATPCQTFSTNPGKTQFLVWNWVPGQTLPLCVIGAYANASNFSLATISGGLNLFVFPIYVGGVGYHTIAPLATWTNPTSDLTLHMGDLGFEIDMREVWVAPDLNAPGYKPPEDGGIDKRITVSVQPILPIDPARRDALISSDTAWYVTGYRVPNASDSQLTSKWGTTYGVGAATWDDRMLRNSGIIGTGAFTGFNTGIAIFGLQLNMEIDDKNFTTFEVGYLASAAQGEDGVKVGSARWMYWSNSTVDTERFGREMTFVPSTVTRDTTIPWTQPTESGGPTNYAALVAFLRGLTINSPNHTPISTAGTGTGEDMGLHGTGTSSYQEDGLGLKVAHVGPINSWTTTIIANGNSTKAIFVERLLNLPEAISPVPDTYYYPAPQWTSTVRASQPTNRNGELRRVFTYTAANKYIQRGGPLNRKYVKFRVPTFVPAQTTGPDMFLSVLSTMGQGESLKHAPHDTDGTNTAANVMTDTDARFLEWGVAPGDLLYQNRGGTTYGPLTITAVTQTTVTFSGTGFASGRTYIEYWIDRNTATAKGECLIDQWYGGDSYRKGGGGCKNIQFWQAMGPIPAGATSVTVYIPNITPGAATLNGVTGVIPDLWEGIPTDEHWNNAWYHQPRLLWTISVMNINSASATVGGLGGPLNWNNMNFWSTEFAIIELGTDSHIAYMNFSN